MKVDQFCKKDVQQQREISRLKSENTMLSKHLEKLNGLQKNNDSQQHQQSVDLRKLRELEADLKQKDLLISSLTENNSQLRKELDEEVLKLRDLGENWTLLKSENEEMKESKSWTVCLNIINL